MVYPQLYRWLHDFWLVNFLITMKIRNNSEIINIEIDCMYKPDFHDFFVFAGQWNNRYYPLTTVVTTSSRSAAHDMLVSGDAEGYLRLFRYPCTSAKAEYVEEKVYSSLVACARFLYNDQNVVTVGGTDAALMLWELVDE